MNATMINYLERKWGEGNTPWYVGKFPYEEREEDAVLDSLGRPIVFCQDRFEAEAILHLANKLNGEERRTDPFLSLAPQRHDLPLIIHLQLLLRSAA